MEKDERRPAGISREERLRLREIQRRKRRRRLLFMRAGVIILAAAAVFFAGIIYKNIKAEKSGGARWKVEAGADDIQSKRPPIEVALLTPNEYSRPQTPLEKVNGIVIHYTGNPGTGAMDNRGYFEGLKDNPVTYASSHFVVGLDGEIVQCVPTNEIAYASNERNADTIAIEVCHPDETGKFNDSTYKSLVWLTGWLCQYLDVNPDNVIRHYDVTGKECPRYFVKHEEAWLTFKEDVRLWTEVN